MRLRWAAAFAAVLLGAGTADSALFTVTNTNTSGAGSLAQAITDANATAAADTIQFNIAGFGVKTIAGTLPPVTEPVTIDGYSQSGTSVNTVGTGATNATLRILLSGADLVVGDAVLRIEKGATTVKGLVISNIKAKTFGIEVAEGASGVNIDGCFIGTTASGLLADSESVGIVVRAPVTIGGTTAAERNLISGNGAAGIELRGSSAQVVGNLIGTDRNGAPVLGNSVGVRFVTGSTNNLVGGSAVGAGNVIAGNDGPGVRFDAGATGPNRVEGNSIFENGGLGIDIAASGVTENDDSESDGAQNFPVLTFARYHGSDLEIEGYLKTQLGSYRLEFFLSDEADPSGFGEGGRFVGVEEVTTDASRTAHFRVRLSVPGIVQGSTLLVTATAQKTSTDSMSEFSRVVEAGSGGNEFIVSNTADSGAGSLRAAVSAAAGIAGTDTIVFAIPGAGPHTIVLQSAISVTTSLVIDGYSQEGATANTDPERSNASLRVLLDGNGAGVSLNLDAEGCVVRGLALGDFQATPLRLLGAADGSRVEGNFVGMDTTGLDFAPNEGDGIVVLPGADGVTIGGDLPHQRNVVSLSGGFGIQDAGAGNEIRGNIIGLTAALGANVGNGLAGIVCNGTGTVIGSDGEGGRNAIAGNGPDGGIAISGVSASARVLGNEIFDNEGLGIDIGADGDVALNDTNDTDAGANGVQNFPVITGLAIVDDGLDFFATLDVPMAASLAEYTIRVYESDSCDPSGNGEGERFLGARTVELSGGDEDFFFTLPSGATSGAFITATATDEALGHTSEFSACEQVGGAALCGDANGDGEVTASDALEALRTAVALAQCLACICDANGVGGITSSDALLILRDAVGQVVDLTCPACP